MRKGKIERCLLAWNKLRTRWFTALVSSQFGQFGAGSRVSPPFRFANLSRIRLGECVIIHRDCWIHVVGDENRDFGEPEIIIRSHAGIGMGATISAARRILIGEHVMLARNVYISDHGHAFQQMDVPIALQGIDNAAAVEIGDSTWIGQNACVLPGVKIGRHCVIGSNSVVTHSVPDFCVAVGAPAAVVKRYNHETQLWERGVTTRE